MAIPLTLETLFPQLKLLALDTSTDACSVALWLDGEVQERFVLARQQHAALVLPMVQALLSEAAVTLQGLDALAFGRGPGSFTGLRIGTGVIQGLAFSADLPVVPVSSLAALAQGQDAEGVLAAFDARMSQVYWGAYRRDSRGLMELVGIEQVVAPEAVPRAEGSGWIGAGRGWDCYAEPLVQRLGECLAGWRRRQHPRARAVAYLGVAGVEAGQGLSAEQALPVYIRDRVAKKPG